MYKAGSAVSWYSVGTKSGHVAETSALCLHSEGAWQDAWMGQGSAAAAPGLQLGWDILWAGTFSGLCPILRAASAADWLHLQIAWRKWW